MHLRLLFLLEHAHCSKTESWASKCPFNHNNQVMYERREYLHNVQGMETRAELRAVWTTRYPASCYLTGLLVHERMRLIARSAPLACTNTLSFAFGFEDNMWSWSMQAFTNEHVCDGDEQKADKRARATSMPTCIDQTRLQSHTKQVGGGPVAPCIHNSIAHTCKYGKVYQVGDTKNMRVKLTYHKTEFKMIEQHEDSMSHFCTLISLHCTSISTGSCNRRHFLVTVHTVPTS